MTTLAFDTATPTGVVAVLDGDRVVERRTSTERAKHGETLLPMIAEALAEVGRGLADVDLLAVGVGPGSFTGLRIGLATAQGLTLASGVQAVGLCSLFAVAAPAVQARRGPVAAVLDAYRGEVYASVYVSDPEGRCVALVPPFSATPDEAARRFLSASDGAVGLVGDGARKYATVFAGAAGGRLALLDETLDAPSAVALGREAQRLRATDALPAVPGLQPIYLRGADAKLPDTPLKL